jgi:spore maturation protein CgeB
MERALRDVLRDEDLAASLSRSGIETILSRHTCTQRARELLAIVRGLRGESDVEPSGTEAVATA